MSNNPDNAKCQDSKCPAKPIVGGHTEGINVSSGGKSTDCSGKNK